MASDDPLDALYASPLDEFTARRDAAAKAAREAGDKAGAAILEAARKPSVTAWACNQVARTEPSSLAALLEAGAALRLAHARMVRHGEAPEMREVMEATRAAEEPLVAAARRVLESAGHAATLEQLRRVRETLHAAAVGADAPRAELAAGRLVRDLELPSLLEIAAGLPEAPPASPASAESSAAAAADVRARARQEREEVVSRTRRAQQEERERARRERQEAQRLAALREADRRVAEQERAVADAEQALALAREGLEAALARRRALDEAS